ncbi:dicarboxylate/amino acid:cation symporter [Isoalcanivorax beigongshangi]|uniref:Dicarboxylate/amino acid:cation symporter n=1 Tax=Isoalcanivorax beigongshangi TaxID=3238810 RepID=A0ABV4AK80_9GAMM
MKLHHQIFIAMALGGLCGYFTDSTTAVFGIELLDAYDMIGALFIQALQMLVVPLITSALISSLVNIGEGGGLGRLGGKTLLYFMLSTLVAVLIGLLVANVLQPGIINGKPAGELLGLAENTHDVLAQIEGRSAGDFSTILLQLVPANLLDAASQGQMLGLISFSLLFGYFLRQVNGAPGDNLRNTMIGLYDTMVRITMFIIRFTPIGVFGLIAATMTRTGLQSLQPLAWFVLAVTSGLALHAFVLLPLAVKLFAKRSPVLHMRVMTPALLTAFSTASSAATLPVTMECMENKGGLSKRVSSFVLPLGSTINMNGSALYECMVVLFIAQASGVELSLAAQFIVLVTAVITSIGVASIPAASLLAITLILSIVGLPPESIGLILVTDRILDMCRTTVNIWSDSVGAVLIARSEGEQGVLQPQPEASV